MVKENLRRKVIIRMEDEKLDLNLFQFRFWKSKGLLKVYLLDSKPSTIAQIQYGIKNNLASWSFTEEEKCFFEETISEMKYTYNLLKKEK